MNKNNAVVLLSGGLNSTVSLFWAIKNFETVHTITLLNDFESRNATAKNSTLCKVSAICDIAKIPANRQIFKHNGGLLTQLNGNYPLQDLLNLTVAANYAIVNGCTSVVSGICYKNYSKNRNAFSACEIALMQFAKNINSMLEIKMPFYECEKDTIIQYAVSNSDCWTALAYCTDRYEKERAKVFESVGLADPAIVKAYKNKELETLPEHSAYDLYC